MMLILLYESCSVVMNNIFKGSLMVVVFRSSSTSSVDKGRTSSSRSIILLERGRGEGGGVGRQILR